MTTLPRLVPLSALARILNAAAELGPKGWQSPGSPEAHADGERAENLSGDLLAGDLLALFSLLRDRNVPHLLVGGVALLKYIEGRNTDDIDLVISVDGLKHLPEIVVQDQDQDFARGKFRSLRVDLLLTANPVFRLAQERYATAHHFKEIQVPCATVEGLVLLKLYALPSLYQQGQMQRAALYETDIAMLYQRHRPKLQPIVDALSNFMKAGQMDELRKIVREIEQRIARMDQSSKD